MRTTVLADRSSAQRSCCAPSTRHRGQAASTAPARRFLPDLLEVVRRVPQAEPDVQINYQSIGSGGGIRQVLEGTVDFGATDGPMTDEQLRQAKAPILHFPTVLGARRRRPSTCPASTQLKLTPDALAGIFLGKITSWNDPAIAKDNPGVALPAQPIVPVHRSDGSGTTLRLRRLPLSKVSPEWAKSVGRKHVGRLAGRARRQGQRGRHRARSSRRRTRSATSSSSTPCRTSCRTPTIKNRSGASSRRRSRA